MDKNWKIAELRLHKKMIRRCRIPIVEFFRVLQPNSGRSAALLEGVVNQARVRPVTKTPTGCLSAF
jgi:hypothetical protein